MANGRSATCSRSARGARRALVPREGSGTPGLAGRFAAMTGLDGQVGTVVTGAAGEGIGRGRCARARYRPGGEPSQSRRTPTRASAPKENARPRRMSDRDGGATPRPTSSPTGRRYGRRGGNAVGWLSYGPPRGCCHNAGRGWETGSAPFLRRRTRTFWPALVRDQLTSARSGMDHGDGSTDA